MPESDQRDPHSFHHIIEAAVFILLFVGSLFVFFITGFGLGDWRFIIVNLFFPLVLLTFLIDQSMKAGDLKTTLFWIFSVASAVCGISTYSILRGWFPFK